MFKGLSCLMHRTNIPVIVVLVTSSGEVWSGWGGEWPQTQTGMGWGWGWPVDSYSQGGAPSAPDITPHQYTSNNVSLSMTTNNCCHVDRIFVHLFIISDFPVQNDL